MKHTSFMVNGFVACNRVNFTSNLDLIVVLHTGPNLAYFLGLYCDFYAGTELTLLCEKVSKRLGYTSFNHANFSTENEMTARVVCTSPSKL